MTSKPIFLILLAIFLMQAAHFVFTTDRNPIVAFTIGLAAGIIALLAIVISWME